jgi:hypothetical protein
MHANAYKKPPHSSLLPLFQFHQRAPRLPKLELAVPRTLTDSGDHFGKPRATLDLPPVPFFFFFPRASCWQL